MNRLKFVVVFGLTILVSMGFRPAIAAGSEMPEPPKLCNTGGCPPEMTAVAKEFAELTTAPDLAGLPHVFSGECYHLAMGYNPSKTHYGVTLLDLNSGEPTFSALFGFFYESNPYGDLNAEEARVFLKSYGSHPSAMVRAESFFGAEYLTPNTSIRYWLRQNPATRDVLLQSRGEFSNFASLTAAFCRMHANRKPGFSDSATE